MEVYFNAGLLIEAMELHCTLESCLRGNLEI